MVRDQGRSLLLVECSEAVVLMVIMEILSVRIHVAFLRLETSPFDANAIVSSCVGRLFKHHQTKHGDTPFSHGSHTSVTHPKLSASSVHSSS